jgi:DNA-binding GntR family transcriptional regulator
MAPLFVTATLADQVYDHLLERIATGEYPAGSALRELDLVAKLGVSRTPIREALLRLSEYGLVSVKGRSARVRQVTRDEVVHIYQVRMALETTATGLACGKLTPDDFAHLDALNPTTLGVLTEPTSARFDRELHLTIARRCGNPVLFQEIRKLLDLVRLAHTQLGRDRRWLTQEVLEHSAILEALRAGDKLRSRRAMRDHLRRACRTNAACATGSPAADPNPHG